MRIEASSWEPGCDPARCAVPSIVAVLRFCGKPRTAFIDEHHNACGVKPICKVLLIAPMTRSRAARKADPEHLSNRSWRALEAFCANVTPPAHSAARTAAKYVVSSM